VQTESLKHSYKSAFVSIYQETRNECTIFRYEDIWPDTLHAYGHWTSMTAWRVSLIFPLEEIRILRCWFLSTRMACTCITLLFFQTRRYLHFKFINTFGPIMRQEYVKLGIFWAISFGLLFFHLSDPAQKLHPINFKLFDMVSRYFGVAVQGSSLWLESILKISMIVNSRQTWNSDFCRTLFDVDRSCLTKIVNIFGYPASKIKVSHIIYGFMVASYKDGEDGRLLLGLKVLIEAPHRLIFLRAVQIVKVSLISKCLEIPADNE